MLVWYAVFDVKFLVPAMFLMKGFHSNYLKRIHYMSVLGKNPQSWFYIEYSIYTSILVLWVKGCQLFRYCMCDTIHWKYFNTSLTATNKFLKRIFYIVDDIIILFYQLLYVLLWVVSSFCDPPSFWRKGVVAIIF